MSHHAHPTIGDGFTDDPTNSTAPEGRYYTDPATYRLELDSVFRREWQYVCHQTQIEEPGAYVLAEIGEESVYAIRQRDGSIGAFSNVCQHRGHQLLTDETGIVAGSIRCPYHAWTYGFDGRLRAAPKHREVAGFDLGCVRLAAVRHEVVGGFVFVNLDPDAAPLAQMAPQLETKMRAMVGEIDQLRYVSHQDFEIEANWKVVCENFLEAYHIGLSGPEHDGLAVVMDPSTYRGDCDGRVIEYLGAGGPIDQLPYETDGTRAFSGRDEGLQQIFLWPNVSFSVFTGANMVFVFLIAPAGPERVAERIIYFSLDGEADASAQGCIDWINGALGVEDVELVERVQRGLRSAGYRPGRLMVDPDRSASWSEHYVHHFNQLVLDAAARDQQRVST